MHHFDNVGLYDALFVMQDKETKTLWNHITGDALYGPLVGRRLGPVGNLLQMSVDQALAVDAAMQVAISDRPYVVNSRQFGPAGPIAGAEGRGRGGAAAGPSTALGAGPGGPSPDRTLSAGFIQTLGNEDTRLSRMELGLGIVTDRTVRFYPMSVIQQRGALIDEINGRKVLVFMDQATFTPAALYVNASRATVDGRDIRLDTGAVVRMGLLVDARGAQVNAERPQQLFSRWYGFSLTFPRPEIFGK